MTALPEVARAFGRAAAGYDRHARLQQKVADWLLSELSPGPRLLDVGCGTGYCLEQLGGGIGLDISAGMLAHCQQKGHRQLLQADASALPLASHSIDTVVSSLALQWCVDLPAALAELARVLRPGGCWHLALPLAGSLNELATAWQDQRPHLLALPAAAKLQALLPPQASLTVRRFTCYYPDLPALRASLKGIGAHHVPGRSSGLTGRHRYQRFLDNLERQRTAQGLPLTYLIGRIQWQKPCLSPAPTPMPVKPT